MRLPEVRRFLLALALPLGLAACGNGAPGDLSKVPPPKPNLLGSGYRLSQLGDLASPDHPKEGAQVIVTGGSVVVVDSFDETHNGSAAGNVYVQDLPVNGVAKPFSGITLFNVAYSPPTLRVGPGDVVDIRGSWDEFAGPSSSPFNAGQTLPEITGSTVSLRFEYTVPPPAVIKLADLDNYDTGRQWLGMLVTLEDVTIASDGYASSSGRYSAKLDASSSPPTVTNALFDLEQSGLSFATGTKYKSITGVVEYFYNFQLAPRSAADLVQ